RARGRRQRWRRQRVGAADRRVRCRSGRDVCGDAAVGGGRAAGADPLGVLHGRDGVERAVRLRVPAGRGDAAHAGGGPWRHRVPAPGGPRDRAAGEAQGVQPAGPGPRHRRRQSAAQPPRRRAHVRLGLGHPGRPRRRQAAPAHQQRRQDPPAPRARRPPSGHCVPRAHAPALVGRRRIAAALVPAPPGPGPDRNVRGGQVPADKSRAHGPHAGRRHRIGHHHPAHADAGPVFARRL
ncbi:hypothetical protein H4R21_006745, partial [Coemansia helicoidea]